MCGTDFPVRTNLELVNYLKQKKNRNLLESHTLFVDDQQSVRKQGWFSPVIKNSKSHQNPLKIELHNYMAFGSAYNFFTRDFMEWSRGRVENYFYQILDF